jgi:ABC-type xylose transport system permease subunit
MLEECFMVLIDALLILAMMFFLFLPITDRRTVQMKLCVLCALLVVFAVTATRTHGSHVQLAGIETTH